MVVPTVSYVFLLTRAVQGLLWDSSGLQNKENKMCLRNYGFEGEAGRRGRCGRADICESNYRRYDSIPF